MLIFPLISSTITVIYVGLFSQVFFRRVRSAKDGMVMLLYALMISWGIWMTVFHITTSKDVAWLSYKVTGISWILLPALAANILMYEMYYEWLNRRRWTIYIVPVILILVNFYIDGAIVIVDLEQMTWGWNPINTLDNVWYWIYLCYLLSYFTVALFKVYQWGKSFDNTAVTSRINLRIGVVLCILIFGGILDLTMPLLPYPLPPVSYYMMLILALFIWTSTLRGSIGLTIHDSTVEQVLDAVPEMIFNVNMKGIIVDANKKSKEVFGEKVINEHLFSLLSDYGMSSDKELSIDHMENLEVSLVLPREGHKVFSVNSSFIYDYLYGPKGYVIMMADMTNRYLMEARLEDSYQKYRRLAEQYYLEANYDKLTGLPNRRQFFKSLERMNEGYISNGSDFSVIFIDINEFKSINDHYGHSAGDQVLVEVAKRLRLVDEKVDYVARLGGDEFVMTSGYYITSKNINRLLEKINHSFSRPVEAAGTLIRIRLAVGYSLFSEHGNLHTVMKSADEHMYRDKAR